MAPPAPTLLSSVKCFGGEHRRYSHPSPCCGGCTMTFAVYLPPNALRGGGASPAPCVWYLSGLTCTDANAAEKAGLQRTASALGLALLFPDTSPRGLAVPGEAEHWDFGLCVQRAARCTQAPAGSDKRERASDNGQH